MTSGDDGGEVHLELAPNVHVEFGKTRILVVAETGALEIGGDVEAGAKVLLALREGVRACALPADRGQAHAIVTELAARGWLLTEAVEAVGNDQFQQVRRWLASVTSRPIAAFEILRRCSVAIVGAGGLGGEVAQHLAAAGIGALCLIDGDVVELQNLNRQFLYDHQTLGRPKVDVAVERLCRLAPDLRITGIRSFLASPTDLGLLDSVCFDLLVNCADQPEDLDQTLAAYCGRRAVPFVMAGVGLHRGYWGPLLPRAAEGLRRFEHELTAAQGDFAAGWDRSRICTASHSPYNSIVAAHLASDVVRHLSGVMPAQALERRLYIDFERLSVTAVGVRETNTGAPRKIVEPAPALVENIGRGPPPAG